MPHPKSHLLLFELLWWLLAIAIACLALLPPYFSVGIFRYTQELALLIIGLVTWARMIFFTNQILWLRSTIVKGFMCVVCVGVFLFAVLVVNNVQNLVDAEGYNSFFSNYLNPGAVAWGTYLSSVSIFAGSGLALCCIGLPVVLIIRIWRQIKTQTRERSQILRQRTGGRNVSMR